jgi:hypothetical protein
MWQNNSREDEENGQRGGSRFEFRCAHRPGRGERGKRTGATPKPPRTAGAQGTDGNRSRGAPPETRGGRRGDGRGHRAGGIIYEVIQPSSSGPAAMQDTCGRRHGLNGVHELVCCLERLRRHLMIQWVAIVDSRITRLCKLITNRIDTDGHCEAKRRSELCQAHGSICLVGDLFARVFGDSPALQFVLYAPRDRRLSGRAHVDDTLAVSAIEV